MEASLQQRLERIALGREQLARYKALKQAVREEVDAQQEIREMERLQTKLQRLQATEAALEEQLAYGLPPGWDSSSSTTTTGNSSSSGGFAWSDEWLQGTEFIYSTRYAVAGGRRLEVAVEQRPVVLEVGERPFAQGGLRRAFYARDKAGGRFVVKRPLLESSKPAKRLAALHCDATAAAMSVAAAQAFNAAAGEVCGRVEYLEASVVILHGTDSSGQPTWTAYLKEAWLDCGGRPFTKWTRNDGHLFPEGVADATIQAFTHFSLRFMQQEAGRTRHAYRRGDGLSQLSVGSTGAAGSSLALSTPS